METSDRPRPMGLELPTGTDPQSIRRRVEALELLLERSFRIPGVNYPIGLDSIIGLVPVVGDAFDVMFRSNTRNLRIIKKHLDKHHPETRVIEG